MGTITAVMDDHDFRRSVERLDGLPIRPTVARQVFAGWIDDGDSAGLIATPALALPATVETDPGWTLARSRLSSTEMLDPAAVLVDHCWWSATLSQPAQAALIRLWRHSAAVALAARRLAREANDSNPELVGRAGMLHHLGLWALAAVDPERLVLWLAADSQSRLALETRWFGTGLSAFGRRLAERWGTESLVIDAVWLHADRDGNLNACASSPTRLTLIQQACELANATPWALDSAQARDCGPIDPRVRIVSAEVQSRCGSTFIEPDASSREEWLTRDNVRLRRELTQTAAAASSAKRLVASLAESSPVESPESWADRAALAWCGEPEIGSVRVVWRTDLDPDAVATEPASGRPPTVTIPLGSPDQAVADLLVWTGPQATVAFAPDPAILAAWNGWARLIAERERLGQLLDLAIGGHRGHVAREELTRRRSALAALAEFAAGAGHEINNPLAVVMGRAQLLLAKSGDAETTRSLRAIITQAQRAHRILRDLMFVARPPEFRPRACQPDEIVRASLRDLQHEAEAQGVRLVLEASETPVKVWADPEPLRQVADILTRNALEASPTGATVRFSTSGDSRHLKWLVHDTGRGMSAADGAHLFDPFYCGRAAGRGLGLGLSRAARIIDNVGGDIRWYSTPGQGATWQVTLPVEEIPAPIPTGKPEAN